jgi:hypothetical protein
MLMEYFRGVNVLSIVPPPAMSFPRAPWLMYSVLLKWGAIK